MFCPNCAKEVAQGDLFCRSCGRSLAPPSARRPIGDTSSREPGELVRRSGEATASLILGLFSFIPFVGLLAVIFGHLARASIRRSGGRLLGDGMAAFGLALGYLSLGVWAIYGLSVLVRPLSPSARRAEERHLVVMQLRTINTAVITYASIYEHSFPPSLAALGPPKTANPNASVEEVVKAENAHAAGLIDEVLASGVSLGYRFTYVAGKPKRGKRVETYTLSADPVQPDEGTHYFTDETGVIRSYVGKEADAKSLPVLDSSE